MLPDHIVSWIRRYTFISIHYLHSGLINNGTCQSLTGPYCQRIQSRRYLYKDQTLNKLDVLITSDSKANIMGNDNNTALIFIENVNINGTSVPQLVIINNSDEISTKSESNLDFYQKYQKYEYNKNKKYGNKIINNLSIWKKFNFYISNNVICVKSTINHFIEKLVNLAKLKIVSSYGKKFVNNKIKNSKDKSKINFSKSEKKVYKHLLDINSVLVLPKSYNEKFSTQSRYPHYKEFYIHSDNPKNIVKSNLLFGEIFETLISNYNIKDTLIMALVWLLRQGPIYSQLFNNFRQEQLKKYYILPNEDVTLIYNISDIVSPYTGIRLNKSLLPITSKDNLRVIRQGWNGISNVFHFSFIRPDINILPRNYSCKSIKYEQDHFNHLYENSIKAEWEGLWVIEGIRINRQDLCVREKDHEKIYNYCLDRFTSSPNHLKLNLGYETIVRLISEKGGFKMNKLFIIEYLPISINNPKILNDYIENSVQFLNQWIRVSGRREDKIQWSAEIPLSHLLEYVGPQNIKKNIDISEYNSKNLYNNFEVMWVNVLDYIKPMYYSMIDSIEFEVHISRSLHTEGVLLAPFIYHTLNELYSYQITDININKINQNQNINHNKYLEIDSDTYWGLVIDLNIDRRTEMNYEMTKFIDMTITKFSKAFPILSIYEAEKYDWIIKQKLDSTTQGIVRKSLENGYLSQDNYSSNLLLQSIYYLFELFNGTISNEKQNLFPLQKRKVY
ncbi:uncharacterized protein CMU_016120 [Cryptosporidium muris RN66]|uniref:Uncharacterized protein n=1 Tax=Cryptosporidium muris (strain RN66) TaxID=441375 RepID=B6ACK9_CRYMR|nr:uncharacterized protein CMU_016120 [Cryptosporidium muris RN66]EEA05863.1 hypothetical protein, conserved [Cryptosporidium muris RN66]|eukprot:XP_002140212.1 hypothetical protein [Cryptosporidium muris RN66]